MFALKFVKHLNFRVEMLSSRKIKGKSAHSMWSLKSDQASFDGEDRLFVSELRTAFSYFDTNGDGSITVEELKIAVEKVDLSIDSNQLHEMIHSIDKNKDGKISIDEFMTLI